MAVSEPVLRLFLLEGPSPGVASLKAELPGVVSTPLGVDIPLHDRGPEEILALCLRFGITARATCIVERAHPG